MNLFNKSYRIRTDVGKDKFLHVKLDRNYDVLEIMSLKIDQKNAYRLHTSNYGVIAGRVLANGAFGIPNAKISVFIPIDNVDKNDYIKSSLYPYVNLNSKDKNGVRYNLLPNEQLNNCHTIIGTFPEKQYVLDNDVVLEVVDKYFKFTTKTNNSGDYMLFGVPTGVQNIHVDIDLSDVGILSQKPRDMVYKGYNITQFENPNKFKYDTNLNSLTQVISKEETVDVIPFWGDEEENIIGITRCDIQIEYKFEPTCVFLGSVVSDTASNGFSRKCIPTPGMGAMDEITTGSGTIEMIRKIHGVTKGIDGVENDVEEFQIQGTQLINGDGVWCYQIPMNLDYMMTDEFGNMVPTNDPNKGIPTRTRVRFRISMQDFDSNNVNVARGKILVPHNPKHVNELDYDFGTDTNEDSFKDLFWNCVYSVKSYIPRIQKGTNWKKGKFTGFKRVNYYGNNNPIPYNNIRIRLPFMYVIMCSLVKLFFTFSGWVNRFIRLYVNFVAGKRDSSVYTVLDGTLCDDNLENVCIIPGVDVSGDTTKDWAVGLVGRTVVTFIEKIGGQVNSVDTGGDDNMHRSEDNNSINKTNEDTNKFSNNSSTPVVNGYPAKKDKKGHFIYKGITITNDFEYLMKCIEMNLAQEYKVIQFDFYNDWINGLIYIPRWFRKIPKKRTFLFNFNNSNKPKNAKEVDVLPNEQQFNDVTIKDVGNNEICEMTDNDIPTEQINKNGKLYKHIKLKNGVYYKWDNSTSSYIQESHLNPVKYLKLKNENDVYYKWKNGEYVKHNLAKTPNIKACNENGNFSKKLNIVQQCGLKYDNEFKITTSDGCKSNSRLVCHKAKEVRLNKRIFKETGIVNTTKTLKGQSVYYFKPIEKDGDNITARLYSTDIILLGTLNSCDKWGIPNNLEELVSSTYQMPPNLALTDSDIEGDSYVSNVDKIGGTFWGYQGDNLFGKNSSSGDALTGWDKNETFKSILKNPEDGNYTEISGIDWGYYGPLQMKKNDGGTVPNSSLYKPGGHFLGLSCFNSETTIKTCVNLARICEYGVLMSQRQTPDIMDSNDNFIDIATIPSGLISKDEINDSNFRQIFATLNSNSLKTKNDPTTQYLVYDFKYISPTNFGGELNGKIKNDVYNRYVADNVVEKSNEYKDDENLYISSTESQKVLEKQIVRTGEFKDNEYLKFRFGISGNTLSNDNFLLTNSFPLYDNSFYFYFGLHDGKTAIDEFKRQYYAVCEKMDSLTNSSIPLIINNVSVENCGLNKKNGKIKINVTKEDDEIEELKFTLISNDNENKQGTSESDYYVFDNVSGGSYSIKVSDAEGVYVVNTSAFVDTPKLKVVDVKSYDFVKDINNTGYDVIFKSYPNERNKYGGYFEFNKTFTYQNKNGEIKNGTFNNGVIQKIVLKPEIDGSYSINTYDVIVTMKDNNLEFKMGSTTLKTIINGDTFIVPVGYITTGASVNYRIDITVNTDNNGDIVEHNGNSSSQNTYTFSGVSIQSISSGAKFGMTYNGVDYSYLEEFNGTVDGVNYNWWNSPAFWSGLTTGNNLETYGESMWKIKDNLYTNNLSKEHYVKINGIGGKNGYTQEIKVLSENTGNIIEEYDDITKLTGSTSGYNNSNIVNLRLLSGNGLYCPEEGDTMDKSYFQFPVIYAPFFGELGIFYFNQKNTNNADIIYLRGNIHNGRTWSINEGFNKIKINTVDLTGYSIKPSKDDYEMEDKTLSKFYSFTPQFIDSSNVFTYTGNDLPTTQQYIDISLNNIKNDDVYECNPNGVKERKRFNGKIFNYLKYNDVYYKWDSSRSEYKQYTHLIPYKYVKIISEYYEWENGKYEKMEGIPNDAKSYNTYTVVSGANPPSKQQYIDSSINVNDNEIYNLPENKVPNSQFTNNDKVYYYIKLNDNVYYKWINDKYEQHSHKILCDYIKSNNKYYQWEWDKDENQYIYKQYIEEIDLDTRQSDMSYDLLPSHGVKSNISSDVRLEIGMEHLNEITKKTFSNSNTITGNTHFYEFNYVNSVNNDNKIVSLIKNVYGNEKDFDVFLVKSEGGLVYPLNNNMVVNSVNVYNILKNVLEKKNNTGFTQEYKNDKDEIIFKDSGDTKYLFLNSNFNNEMSSDFYFVAVHKDNEIPEVGTSLLKSISISKKINYKTLVDFSNLKITCACLNNYIENNTVNNDNLKIFVAFKCAYTKMDEDYSNVNVDVLITLDKNDKIEDLPYLGKFIKITQNDSTDLYQWDEYNTDYINNKNAFQGKRFILNLNDYSSNIEFTIDDFSTPYSFTINKKAYGIENNVIGVKCKGEVFDAQKNSLELRFDEDIIKIYNNEWQLI